MRIYKDGIELMYSVGVGLVWMHDHVSNNTITRRAEELTEEQAKEMIAEFRDMIDRNLLVDTYKYIDED